MRKSIFHYSGVLAPFAFNIVSILLKTDSYNFWMYGKMMSIRTVVSEIWFWDLRKQLASHWSLQNCWLWFVNIQVIFLVWAEIEVHIGASTVQVLWAWHQISDIFAFASVIKVLSIAALSWMLALWSSWSSVFVETGSFCSLQTLHKLYEPLLRLGDMSKN